MSTVVRHVAQGPGWRVSDVVCRAGPHDRPFEERHDHACVALVTRGTFAYRSALGRAQLAAGTVLLGDAGQCFECGHDHSRGDRCIAFHFAPEMMESIATSFGRDTIGFACPRLPPSERLLPLFAAAEAACADADTAQFEDIALAVGGSVTGVLQEARPQRPTARDMRRVAEAVHRLENEFEQPMTLDDLARAAQVSRFHFLRIFREAVGLTPYRFLLRVRLHNAAVALRRSDEPISAIAFDMGFGDLSTFNRRFRRVMGMNPGRWRARARAA